MLWESEQLLTNLTASDSTLATRSPAALARSRSDLAVQLISLARAHSFPAADSSRASSTRGAAETAAEADGGATSAGALSLVTSLLQSGLPAVDPELIEALESSGNDLMTYSE